MTITNILHVTGTKMDLYSPSYFKEVEGEREAVDPLKRWVDGDLFGYGIIKENDDEYRFVIDIRELKRTFDDLTFESIDPMMELNVFLTLKEDDPDALQLIKDCFVKHPYVPPAVSYTGWRYKTRKVTTEDVEFVRDPVKEWKGEWVHKVTEKTYFVDKYDDIIDESEYEWEKKRVHLDAETEHDQLLKNYWISKYEVWPKYISVDQHPEIKASYGNWKEPDHIRSKLIGDYESRHLLPDAVFEMDLKKHNIHTMIPFCNGLCCFPRVLDNRLYASQGARLSYNKKDRNRRWVLVDFGPVGGCEFYHLSDLQGDIKHMMLDLPEPFDPHQKTALVVIKGRLFFPDEFTITDNHLFFDLNKYTAIHEIDYKLCRGDFVRNSRVIEPDRIIDLQNDDNSFLIIINRGDLQLIKHQALHQSWPMKKMKRGSDSLSNVMTNDFDRCARGLMFEMDSRSVHDYVREEQTMTFYADKYRKWEISNVFIYAQSLLALSDEYSNNLMSARGFVLDSVEVEKYHNVVWPRLTILDFVFRG